VNEVWLKAIQCWVLIIVLFKPHTDNSHLEKILILVSQKYFHRLNIWFKFCTWYLRVERKQVLFVSIFNSTYIITAFPFHPSHSSSSDIWHSVNFDFNIVLSIPLHILVLYATAFYDFIEYLSSSSHYVHLWMYGVKYRIHLCIRRTFFLHFLSRSQDASYTCYWNFSSLKMPSNREKLIPNGDISDILFMVM